MAVISRVSALVPVYDFLTAKEYAERLLYVQVIFCTFGALSWAFTGVVQVSFGFALLALVGFEIGSVKLLKVCGVPCLMRREIPAYRGGGRASSARACSGARAYFFVNLILALLLLRLLSC
jgi:hypothetical protein